MRRVSLDDFARQMLEIDLAQFVDDDSFHIGAYAEQAGTAVKNFKLCSFLVLLGLFLLMQI